jgi:hypothetical protein
MLPRAVPHYVLIVVFSGNSGTLLLRTKRLDPGRPSREPARRPSRVQPTSLPTRTPSLGQLTALRAAAAASSRERGVCVPTLIRPLLGQPHKTINKRPVGEIIFRVR